MVATSPAKRVRTLRGKEKVAVSSSEEEKVANEDVSEGRHLEAIDQENNLGLVDFSFDPYLEALGSGLVACHLSPVLHSKRLAKHLRKNVSTESLSVVAM